MTGALRYAGVTAARTRAPLVALAAAAFALIGVYAYSRNEVGESFGVTAVMCCGLAAWLVAAVLTAEPPAQADIAAAALGGRRGRGRLDATVVACAAAGLTAAFVAYPLLLGIVVERVFDPGPTAGDVVAALIAHASCALLGGALGLLFSPPRVTRRATTAALVLAALVALAAVGALAGPVAVAEALDDGGLGSELLLQCLGCLALAAAAAVAATWWAGRAG